jgi:polyhydroxybutyrate depolymerase
MRRLPSHLCRAGLVIVALALVSVVPSSRAQPPAAAGSCAGTASGARNVDMRVTLADGSVRTTLVHVPVRAKGPAPLVLAFHGWGGSGRFMARYSGLSALSDRSGFVAAFPDGAGTPAHWTLDEDAPGARDDLAFVDGLVDRLVTDACVDPSRIYAVGVSNGGGFAARVACERPGRIAAVVSVAGAYRDPDSCDPDRPVSLMEVHGTADPVVPYAGGGRAGAHGVVAWLRSWARRDGCSPHARIRRVDARTVRLDWSACHGGAVISHLRLLGGGHAWPGADPPDPGPRSRISGARVAWSFLAGHRLPPPGR